MTNMTKLDKVRLKDVLSHVDTQVDIAPCVTVFTGDSDSGKSSVMRGLLHAYRNQPAGIDLLRHGAKRGACAETHIEGRDKAGNPFSIIRRRGNTRNEYEVNGEMLKAFGLGAPPPVTSMLDLSEHAFQVQSDGHFLLSVTDGEVARVMGRTVGLAKIDKAFAYVRKLKTENDTALRVAEADVQRESTVVKQYDGLDDAAAQVEALTELERKRDAVTDTVANAARLLCTLTAIPWNVDTVSAKRDMHAWQDAVHAEHQCRLATDDGNLLLDAIQRVPRPARVVAARELAEAVRANVERMRAVRDDVANIQKLELSISAVPQAAETKGVKKVVDCLFEISLKRVSVASAVSDTLRVIRLMDQLMPDCATGVQDARRAIADLVHSKSHDLLSHHKIEILDVSGLLNNVTSVECDLAYTEKACELVRQEIAQYASANPTCPNCGAEQEHWNKTK